MDGSMADVNGAGIAVHLAGLQWFHVSGDQHWGDWVDRPPCPHRGLFRRHRLRLQGTAIEDGHALAGDGDHASST
jgi:hypothetical protein